ncbi:MAG: DUF2162 family putative transporter [Archaeoglobaceae archaeon]|nr:DUF2162 family putative transporter [Archaeoglobaceae archaeon]
MKFDKNLMRKSSIFVFLAIIIFVSIYNPFLTGIIAGAVITALKAGAGCRYGDVDKNTVYLVSFSYFLLALFLGLLIEKILDSLSLLLNYTIIFHIIIAILLLIAGYLTIRKSYCGLDISNKTFLAMVIPCPLCFGAIFISCYFASVVLEVSGAIIGLIVGTITSSGILILSVEKKKDPEKLGTIMLLLGVYYILSMFLIPAIVQGMSLKYSIQHSSFSPYLLLLIFPFVLGIIKGVMRYG